MIAERVKRRFSALWIWSLYLAAIILLILLFFIALSVLNKNAAQQHETIFNEQQALQTYLVRQSIQGNVDELIRMSEVLSNLLSLNVRSGALDADQAREHFELVGSISPGIIAQVFMDCQERPLCSSASGKGNSEVVLQLAREWGKRGKSLLSDGWRKYVIPPFHVTEENQLMGIVLPVEGKEGCVGVLVCVADLGPLLERYVAPMRSGEYGAGYALDGTGTILYDHESEIIGRNIFDGMHDAYPGVLELDRKLISQSSGMSDYSFTVERGGKVSRKLIAWNSVTVGGRNIVICLSAPDMEINASIGVLKQYHLILAGAFGLLLLTMSIAFQRYKASETLSRNEELFRQFSDAAWEAIVIHEHGLILQANRQFWEMQGYPPDSPSIGLSVYDTLDVASSLRVREFIETGECGPYEVVSVRRDGTRFPAEVRVREMEFQGRAVRVAAIRDISERKRAEEELATFNRELEKLVAERTQDIEAKNAELEEANKRLTELDSMKSAFLSSVSHELRTPLTSIMGFAKIMEKDLRVHVSGACQGHDVADRKVSRAIDNLGIIVHEGERLTRLVNDVLDITRIEDERLLWHDTRFSLRDLAERAVRATEGLFEGRDVELESSIDRNLPDVLADRDRMQQVLANLLNNAAKFTVQGHVRLTVERTPDGVRISVQDTGKGIGKDDLERIFSKFYQAEAGDTLHEGPRGTGLGLAISRNIVRHYGGSIWAESEVNAGSTFIVDFPSSLFAL